jgi:hypothetical protein
MLSKRWATSAVSRYARFFVFHRGQRDQQLGLGASLQSEPPGPARLYDFFDQMALLIDFDGKDTAVRPIVAVLADRVLE